MLRKPCAAEAVAAVFTFLISYPINMLVDNWLFALVICSITGTVGLVLIWLSTQKFKTCTRFIMCLCAFVLYTAALIPPLVNKFKQREFSPSDFLFEINGKPLVLPGQKIETGHISKKGVIAIRLFSSRDEELTQYLVAFSASGCQISSDSTRWKQGATQLTDNRPATSFIYTASIQNDDVPLSRHVPKPFPDIHNDCEDSPVFQIELISGHLRLAQAFSLKFLP